MSYESVKAVVTEYGIAKATFHDKMKNAFNDIFKTFFNLYPEIEAVAWNQYTPYFNDGEPCVFGVGFLFGLSKSSDEDFDVDDISSAYDLEYRTFPYDIKPSDFKYANRHKYPSYEADIQAYEKCVAENPRYEVICEGWKELKDILASIPDEIYENVFDDHVTVIATKNGIITKEYDHD